MTHFFIGIAAFLVLTLIAGMRRVVLGPSRADRMLSAQLFGTTGVAILLVLAAATEERGVVDAALVFALLAVINVTVFVRSAWKSGPES